MDKYLYEMLSNYFNVLEKTGYISYTQAQKALVLGFYRDFVYHDYAGLLTASDYRCIEKALDCLYGSTCLIPYTSYMRTGNLHLNEVSELAHRVAKLEETEVLKVIHNTEDTVSDIESDVIIVSEDS